MKKETQKSIIRCTNAGVFFAIVKKLDAATRTAELQDCRKVWYWSGANAVEELAMNGTAKPNDCSLTVTVPSMTVTEVCQIIPCSEKAEKILDSIKEWSFFE